MDIYESGEMYLETILKIKGKKPCVHSVDICDELGYSKSSVSKGVKILKIKGYIDIRPSGEILFTEKGAEKANEIYFRHNVITKFLIKIGVDLKTAEDDACKIEHDISEITFINMQKFLENN